MPGSKRPAVRPWRSCPILADGDLAILAMIAAVAVCALLAALILTIGAFVMRRYLTLAALGAACLLTSGCITSGLVRDLTPEAKRELALKVIERCGGSINISAAGASGQMGGALQGGFNIAAQCPIPAEPSPAP